VRYFQKSQETIDSRLQHMRCIRYTAKSLSSVSIETDFWQMFMDEDDIVQIFLWVISTTIDDRASSRMSSRLYNSLGVSVSEC